MAVAITVDVVAEDEEGTAAAVVGVVETTRVEAGEAEEEEGTTMETNLRLRTISLHVRQMLFHSDIYPHTYPVHPPWLNNWIKNS